jgi:hypothetical protein
MGTLDYFCYISRNKVDQLYEQIDPEAAYEITETKMRERSVSAEAGLSWGIPHLLSLFRTGGTYGRRGVIQREAKVKETYIQKLKVVLSELARDTPIPPLTDLPGPDESKSGYRHFHGEFRLDGPVANPRVDTVVTLGSAQGARELLLDCSLRNFSEGPMPDGTFTLNSANARFFQGDVTLSMTTVFIVLELRPEKVVGSPLFLKLSMGEQGGQIRI